jgi:uncharacterized protein YraI
MRILLSLLLVAVVVYAAQAIFWGEETTPSSANPVADRGSETAPPAANGKAPAAQALTAEELAPSPANSQHAITVEQAVLPAETRPAGSETTTAPSGSANPPPATEPHPSFVKVMSPASIRAGPLTSAAIVGVAQPGVEAQVVSRSSDWVEIIDPGSKKTGWIHQSFLAPQAEPLARAVPPQEVDAALATPENDAAGADDDLQPSTKSKKHRHASRHRHRHRHGIAFGWVYLPY